MNAQREACEAYIRSQKGTGWVALPDMSDDGGISGGTMERPALRRLLSDIAAGRVMRDACFQHDTVVVYKVDRLTRSLNDFAKIVEAFDAKGVSFVQLRAGSAWRLRAKQRVTQQFDTTTSMGRLTLNMLLSFAQFERVDIRPETVDVSVRLSMLPDVVKPKLDIRRLPEKPEGPVEVLSVPARLRRTGMETKLLIQGATDPAHRQADRSLLRLIAMARRFNELVTTGAGLTVTELAIQAGVSRSYFSRILRLSFLAPEITKAIVQGRQPVLPEVGKQGRFSAIKLMGAGQFACVWSDQHREFGFD